MNYLKSYIRLIRKAEARNNIDGYIERHHVFPVSIYGDNNRIVKLTYREHFLAHLLLAKIFEKRYGFDDYRTRKMKCAVGMMTITSKDERIKTSHHYERARRLIRDAKKGKKRPDMVGKRYFGADEKTIKDLTRRQSEARRGKHTNYPKTRKPLSGRTQEVFDKISMARKQTKDKYAKMSDSEFWDWVKKQTKFTKVNGRKDRPNVNVTRAMVAKGIPLCEYYSESDFSPTWFSKGDNKTLFYGVRDSLN